MPPDDPATACRLPNDLTQVAPAVDRAANQAKCDDGPGEWMPPDKRYRCSYDER